MLFILTALRRKPRLRPIIAVIATAVLLTSGLTVTADDAMNFLTRRGDRLFDGDREFRFISFNIPNLMVIEDAYEFTRPNPWRWPDEFEIEDALESIRQMGGRVARTYVISVHREGSDMGEFVHVHRPGDFNEEGFRVLDKVVEVARRKGIRVIIPIVDQAKWWGGIGEYAAFRGKQADSFWNDPQIIEDFKATIRHLITRKNTLTGVAYRDEPAIFGWETGNEIDATPEWTRQIAAYIKELDKNHVVIDGKSLHGVPVNSLQDPNIDCITTHHYPWGDDHDFVRPIREAHALTKGKKAYFVGEFGFVETPHISAAIDAVVNDDISGAMLWSLRMHRREGGFYWHMEVGTGRSIYKAFHWPGFTSGDRYDERLVMQMMRDKGFRIQGTQPPPISPPEPPKLLPIERVSAISWQGSAGASGYDVWRASNADGPWTQIAENVSDADVQYRPLFNDADAVPGNRYWYRIVARNAAGLSDTSNTVGPVDVECRTLLDECHDLSLTADKHGDVTPASENARTVQEDCHRLAMQPGSTAVYRTDGPIDRWRIYSFVRKEDASLRFEISQDGKSYEPVGINRRAFPSSQTVYGYLTPVLFEGHAPKTDVKYLRISMPESQASRSDKSIAGSDANPPAAPLELSRVEIEYDCHSGAATQRQAKNARPAAPVNSTVFLDNPLRPDVVLDAIDVAAGRGDRRVNVVVTIHVDLTEELRIKSFGSLSGPDGEYQSYTHGLHGKLKESLRRVFARALEHDMDIYILPHIDAGGKVRTWRNWVDFDPLESYQGFSYDKLMIATIADALEDMVDDDSRIEMALSGEMGTSLFLYPESYRKIISQLRERPRLKQLKVGISLNHGGIAGSGNPTGVKDIELSDHQRDQMQALINDCDFVGMSFYAPVTTSPTADDFVRGIDRFMGEFDQYGLKVPQTTPMHFSEVGIGGGRVRNGEVDPSKAVEAPWEGSADPRRNPWRTEPMKNLRCQYHRALLDFLARQPARWRVSAAFFWSMGSWDPQGMQDPEFGATDIIAEIDRHNRTAERQTGPPLK